MFVTYHRHYLEAYLLYVEHGKSQSTIGYNIYPYKHVSTYYCREGLYLIASFNCSTVLIQKQSLLQFLLKLLCCVTCSSFPFNIYDIIYTLQSMFLDIIFFITKIIRHTKFQHHRDDQFSKPCPRKLIGILKQGLENPVLGQESLFRIGNHQNSFKINLILPVIIVAA